MRPNEFLFGQSHRVLPRDSLKLPLREIVWVEPDASERPTKRYVGDHVLKGIDGREGNSLLECDILTESHPTLHWHEMVLVLCSVAGEGLNRAIVSLDWNLESEAVVASHDILKHIEGHVTVLTCTVVKHLDLLEVAWLDYLV